VFRNLFLLERLWGRLTLMRGPVVAQLVVVVVELTVSFIAFPRNWPWNCTSVSYEGFLAKLPYHGD